MYRKPTNSTHIENKEWHRPRYDANAFFFRCLGAPCLLALIALVAGRVADDKFNWAVEQLVDLPYFWLTSSDNATVRAHKLESQLNL